MKNCKLWFCDGDHYARGYCQKHYQSWLRHGSPLSPNKEDILRANSIVSLGRQILAELVKHIQDESLLQLSHTFLDNTSEDESIPSNLPPCNKCGVRPTLLTDGKTFVKKSCECKTDPIPIQQLFGDSTQEGSNE